MRRHLAASRRVLLASLLIPVLLAVPAYARGGGGRGSAAGAGNAVVTPFPSRTFAGGQIFDQPGLTTISRIDNTSVTPNSSGGGTTTTTNHVFSVNGSELSISRNASTRVMTDASGRVVSSSQTAFATIDRSGPAPADITTTPIAIVASPSGNVTVVSRASVTGPGGPHDIGTVVDSGRGAGRAAHRTAANAAARRSLPPGSHFFGAADDSGGTAIRNPTPAAAFIDANGNSAVFSTVTIR
jgi:hypothetical protein